MRSEYKRISEEKIIVRKFVEVILDLEEAKDIHQWLEDNVNSEARDEGLPIAELMYHLEEQLYM